MNITFNVADTRSCKGKVSVYTKSGLQAPRALAKVLALAKLKSVVAEIRTWKLVRTLPRSTWFPEMRFLCGRAVETPTQAAQSPTEWRLSSVMAEWRFSSASETDPIVATLRR